jgi:hypothetical protein
MYLDTSSMNVRSSVLQRNRMLYKSYSIYMSSEQQTNKKMDKIENDKKEDIYDIMCFIQIHLKHLPHV